MSKEGFLFDLKSHNFLFNSRPLPIVRANQPLEPINFKIYERVKHHRRLKLIKPQQDPQLFLEG